MGVLPVVLIILAMKIPIFGLFAFVWWAARGYDRAEPEKELRKAPPRRPRPHLPGTRPHRRGPHGGAAAARPIHARDCELALTAANRVRSSAPTT